MHPDLASHSCVRVDQGGEIWPWPIPWAAGEQECACLTLRALHPPPDHRPCEWICARMVAGSRAWDGAPALRQNKQEDSDGYVMGHPRPLPPSVLHILCVVCTQPRSLPMSWRNSGGYSTLLSLRIAIKPLGSDTKII